MSPQLLIAGHIVKDITACGRPPGGGALYPAVAAAMSVEGRGIESIGERGQIEARMVATGAGR